MGSTVGTEVPLKWSHWQQPSCGCGMGYGCTLCSGPALARGAGRLLVRTLAGSSKLCLLFLDLVSILACGFPFLGPCGRRLVGAAGKEDPGRAWDTGAAKKPLCFQGAALATCHRGLVVWWEEGNHVCVCVYACVHMFTVTGCANCVCSLHVQVVSGMNYFLDVKLGRTTCTKSQTNLDSCPFHDQPHLKRVCACWEQGWGCPWGHVTAVAGDVMGKGACVHMTAVCL